MSVAWQMLSRPSGPQALGAERFPALRTQAPQRREAWAEHWLPDSNTAPEHTWLPQGQASRAQGHSLLSGLTSSTNLILLTPW